MDRAVSAPIYFMESDEEALRLELKTDPAVVAKLNAAINEVVSEQTGRDHLSKLGFRLVPRGVAESQSYLRSETGKWGTMVKAVGVYVD